MTDILQAARSYYGLAGIDSCITQLFTNQAGQACVAFEIPLSPEDFIAIVERMKAMQEAESQQVEQAPVFGEDPDTHAIRQRYNALSKEERGKYGSFGRYLSAMMNAVLEEHEQDIDGHKVAHIDAPETEEPTTRDAVWLHFGDATPAQRQHASDHKWIGEDNYLLIQAAMLTEEQRQKAKESKK